MAKQVEAEKKVNEGSPTQAPEAPKPAEMKKPAEKVKLYKVKVATPFSTNGHTHVLPAGHVVNESHYDPQTFKHLLDSKALEEIK